MSMQATTRLLSTVLTLRYEPQIPYGEFSGRRAQRLFFDLLRTIDPALVDESHSANSSLTYSISSLIYQSDSTYWMRVASADPRVVEALLRMKQLQLPQRCGVGVVLRVQTSGHEWAGEERLGTLIDRIWRLPVPSVLLLDVHTPTSVNSLGLFRPFPDPVLLFRSLYDRWRPEIAGNAPYTPDAELWSVYTQYHLALQDAQRLTLHNVDHKKGEVIPAFSGILQVCRYAHSDALWKTAQRSYDRYDAHLLELAEQIRARQEDLARWVHLLARLALYSGVGVKTGWGMGMVRLLPYSTRP